MAPARPDSLAAAGRVRTAPLRPRWMAPGQIGLGVVALALVLAAVVAVSGDGQAYWLCVPAGLAAGACCRSGRAETLAVLATIVGAGAPTIAWASDRPALWPALVVPLAAGGVLHAVRIRLQRERDGLREGSLVDPLTRVANRRALLDRTEHELARHGRSGRSFTVVMLDLDGFKALNDRFGHGAGDDLLRDVGGALAHAMRAQDLVARFGGDEFCVLAPETDGGGAGALTARVHTAVGGVTAGVAQVRASLGVAVFPGDGESAQALIDAADARLLEAKRELYRRRSTPRRAAHRAA